MHCLACDCDLTDFESTVKYASTGKYVDLCNGCRSDLGNVAFIEREDLRHETTSRESEDQNQED